MAYRYKLAPESEAQLITDIRNPALSLRTLGEKYGMSHQGILNSVRRLDPTALDDREAAAQQRRRTYYVRAECPTCGAIRPKRLIKT